MGRLWLLGLFIKAYCRKGRFEERFIIEVSKYECCIVSSSLIELDYMCEVKQNRPVKTYVSL
jgi:hypothetical protein